MIDQARGRSAGSTLPVEFRIGDAHHLQIADGTFDSCRASRVVQHLDDPRQAIVEMARVARSGGRVVVLETDWETLVVDSPYPTVTRRILNFRSDSIRNGWMGRQLSRLLKDAGLIDVSIELAAVPFTEYAQANRGFQLDTYAERAREAGIVTAAEATAWLSQMIDADSSGSFFASYTTFLASARKS